MIYNIQIGIQESHYTDLLRRNPKALPVQSFNLAANLFFFLPDAQNCKMTTNIAFISSLNAVCVVLIFTRYFNVDYGFWKRNIAPLRFTSLLVTLVTVPSMSFSAHFLQESFLCTSVTFGMRQRKKKKIYIYIYIYIYMCVRNKLTVTS